MASQVNVFGPCQVWFNEEFLGYSRNGVDHTDEAYFLDVPGDERGGDEGPPIDVQFLGKIIRLRVECTKYDGLIADNVTARVKSAAPFIIDSTNPSGTLMFSSEHYSELKLIPLNTGVNTDWSAIKFHLVIPRQPIEVNRGTKFATFVCEFECHADSSGSLASLINVVGT